MPPPYHHLSKEPNWFPWDGLVFHLFFIQCVRKARVGTQTVLSLGSRADLDFHWKPLWWWARTPSVFLFFSFRGERARGTKHGWKNRWKRVAFAGFFEYQPRVLSLIGYGCNSWWCFTGFLLAGIAGLRSLFCGILFLDSRRCPTEAAELKVEGLEEISGASVQTKRTARRRARCQRKQPTHECNKRNASAGRMSSLRAR